MIPQEANMTTHWIDASRLDMRVLPVGAFAAAVLTSFLVIGGGCMSSINVLPGGGSGDSSPSNDNGSTGGDTNADDNSNDNSSTDDQLTDNSLTSNPNLQIQPGDHVLAVGEPEVTVIEYGDFQ